MPNINQQYTSRRDRTYLNHGTQSRYYILVLPTYVIRYPRHNMCRDNSRKVARTGAPSRSYASSRVGRCPRIFSFTSRAHPLSRPSRDMPTIDMPVHCSIACWLRGRRVGQKRSNEEQCGDADADADADTDTDNDELPALGELPRTTSRGRPRRSSCRSRRRFPPSSSSRSWRRCVAQVIHHLSPRLAPYGRRLKQLLSQYATLARRHRGSDFVSTHTQRRRAARRSSAQRAARWSLLSRCCEWE